MDDVILLKDIHADESKELIINWQFIPVNEDCRIYFKPTIFELEPEDIKRGFRFCAVLLTGEEECLGQKPEQLAEIMYQGVAYWDGIRHLYMDDEQTGNYGYHFYPSLDNHIAVLNALKELEKQYCAE